MKRVMHQIAVETDDAGNIVLSQALNDLNEPDPQIQIRPEQAPLVAAWLFEAGQALSEGGEENDRSIPVRFFANGPTADPESLSVYNNNQGMIILKIDEDTFIEISPVMAKRLRDQLSTAIRSSLADMLRPDTDA